METLAIAYAYATYEQEQGITPTHPVLICPDLLPNGRWLTYLGILLFSAQMVISQGAIATPTVFPKPIVGATVNITNGCLNARTNPQGKIVTCIKKGATLKDIIKEENGWYQLKSGNWVSSTYVKLPTNGNPAIPNANRPLLFRANKPLRGEDVRQLQEHLNRYELLAKPLEVDGIFGKRTKLAVEAFQEQQNIPMDGIVGTQTRAALKLQP